MLWRRRQQKVLLRIRYPLELPEAYFYIYIIQYKISSEKHFKYILAFSSFKLSLTEFVLQHSKYKMYRPETDIFSNNESCHLMKHEKQSTFSFLERLRLFLPPPPAVICSMLCEELSNIFVQ